LKSDREFLNGIWEKVSKIEYEETQKKAAEIRHKKIVITNIAIVLAIIVTFAFFILGNLIIDLTSFYIISTVFLIAAYWSDKFISGEKSKKNLGGKELHEN